MPQLGNIVRLTTTPDGAGQFAEILRRALVQLEQEDGTTLWLAGRDENDPTNFFIVDLFVDDDARKRHFSGPAAALILGEGGPLLADQPEISSLELLVAKNVE